LPQAAVAPQASSKTRKRFFLKKEAKTFARLSPTRRRKSFLVLFFKKERLASFT